MRGAGTPHIELRLAGTFVVVRDGAPLADGEIGSRKARTLLKLLTVERPGLVPADRIIGVLWPGRPPAAAEQNVASLVSRLRGVLGPAAIAGSRQGYRLAGREHVEVDLDVAAGQCDLAERQLAEAVSGEGGAGAAEAGGADADGPGGAGAGTAARQALEAAGRALGLLAPGTALADEPYAAWGDPARDELRELLRRARLAAAEAALAIGDARLAARQAAAAMAADPLDEAAHRWYMSASAVAGEPARALSAYAALRERLSEELGTGPAAQTQQLHLAILGGQQAAPAADGGGNPVRAAGSGVAGPGAGASGTAAPGTAEPGAGASGTGPPGPAEPGMDAPGRAEPAVLAGRDSELAVLRAAWRAAVAGGPGLAVIAGEAGIGKTTLAERLAAEAGADGATVLRTRCYETERSLFLQPVVEALGPVLRGMTAAGLGALLGEHAAAAAALLPGAAALLGPPPAWRGSPEMERRRAFEAVTALLAGLAARQPVVLVVDDLQYAGRSTVELVHYLRRHTPGCRLLTVVTVRAEQEPQVAAGLTALATRVEVGPLSAAAVGELAGRAGQGDFAGRILQRTGGHTLFVVEVLRALAAGDTGVPESLRDAVQARLHRTGTAAETLLRAASVLGPAVDPLTLASLLDLPPATVLELCELARQARLLVARGADYEFANDLIQEVVYATTPQPARLALHRRAADLLTGQPEALARHAAAAGDWRRASRAWLIAAEEAMRSFAVSDAVALAGLALDAAGRGGDPEVAARGRLVRGRGHEAAGAQAEALADFTAGKAQARTAGDQRLEMLLLRELGGDVPVSLGLQVSYCESHLADGLRIAEVLGDRVGQATLLARLAILASNRLQLGAALDYGRRGAAAGRAAGDERALAAGLDGLKTAYLYAGQAAELREVLAELDPLLRRLGDLFLLQWTVFESAFLAVAAANWDGAVTAIGSALKVNRRGGYPHLAAWYVAHLCWIARLRGHDADAVRLGRQALGITRRHGHSWCQAAACAMLGGALQATGDRAGAISLFEQGLAAAEVHGAEAHLLRCAAPLAAATGSAELLARAADLLATAGTGPGAWVLGDDAFLAVARAWLARDEPERARAALAPLLAMAGRVPWTATLAAVLAADGRALARLGERDRARASLRRAAELARRHELPHVLSDALDAERTVGG
jgi:DNA-binding SARP family transcriptional activator